MATGVSALSPETMGYGPVEASRRALARAGMPINDIDLPEVNEAFVAQVIPSYRDLGIDIGQLNVNGGAIAVGHPFGMTGAPDHHHADQLAAIPRQAPGARDHVRRRPGHGPRARAAQLRHYAIEPDP
jgi:acetyl-CoA acetyltransferase